MLINLSDVVLASSYRIAFLIMLNTVFFERKEIEIEGGSTLKVGGINPKHPAGHPVQLVDQFL